VTRGASNKTLTLVLCCLAQFMVILDVSIVNVALPSIRGDLGFTGTELQWIVNAYTLTFAGFLLLGGRAADLLGRRRVFVAGMLLFALASLVGGLAQDKLILIVARAIQGLGGAVVAPATLSILATTFTDTAERNKALGLWGAMGGAGGAAGALLGGALTQALSWRWVLFINLPIGIIAAVAAWRVIAESRREGATRHFDLSGAATVTAGLVVLVYGIVRTEVNGWGSATTIVTLAVGLALLGAFLVIEGRLARVPLMPLRIFRSRPLSTANLVVFALGSAVFAMWYFVTLYLQNVLGYSPLRAGFAFLPMTLLIVVCSRFAGPVVSRRGPWGLLATGMTMIAVGMLLFTQIDANGTYLSDVLAPSLLCAAGIGFSFVPVTIAATTGVDPSESGLASGLVNTSRQMGGSLGLAILATAATARTESLAGSVSRGDALTEGFDRAFTLGAVFALAGALAAVLAAGTRQRRRRAEAAEPTRAVTH
jgi:EmrB/QacA subfamily drug resistance transporter